MYIYKTHGTCSTEMQIELDGDTIKRVCIINGCRGNTQGVSRLAEGRKVQDVINLLSGILCRGGTSCPDQLATALKQIQSGELKECR